MISLFPTRRPDPLVAVSSRRVRRFWVGVACAEHVARGRAGGFMQVCHGKGGPLRRMSPGDGVAYYSPTTRMGVPDGLQSFTALGEIRPGDPYPFDMGDGFVPFRRDVAWSAARTTPIRPLLEDLELTRGRIGWGAVFRFGVTEIVEADFRRLASAMQA
jgi:hypothetical protein